MTINSRLSGSRIERSIFMCTPIPMRFFFIIDGEMQLEFRDKIVDLRAGEMCVVPKGAEHRPICTTEVICMLIEKEGTLTPENTGGTYRAT